MGRKRKLTARALKNGVERYFNSIRSETPMMRCVPVLLKIEDGTKVPKIDEFGHVMMKYEPVVSVSGEPVMKVDWVEPPSIIGMCLFLGIDRTTFYRWCNPEGDMDEGEEEFCNIATRARGRIEAYLTAKTEDKTAARGAIANLEANFGWKRKREIGLDQPTQRAVAMASMTSEEKLSALREMGMTIPWEENEEGTDDDE